MNTIAASSEKPFSNGAVLASYLLEAHFEFLRVLRTPAFAVPTLLFPPMFYLLFGLLLNRGNHDAAQYLFATYSVFGVMAPGLFGFGVGVAVERERGWLSLKRVAPMPLGGVRLALAQWLLLGAIAAFGVLPFCALGLVIGSRANAAAAPAIVNFIYLPMAFLSGLWIPLSMLPGVLSQIAPLWPAYHLAELALGVIGQGSSSGSVPWHILALVAFTAACFAIARRRLARAE